jgi:hypothetical protein
MTVNRLETADFRFRDENIPPTFTHRTERFDTLDHDQSLTPRIKRLNWSDFSHGEPRRSGSPLLVLFSLSQENHDQDYHQKNYDHR